MTSAVATARPPLPRRGSKWTICLALILILIAAVFGTRSFLEITADEPASMLDAIPARGHMPGRAAKMEVAEAPTTDAEFLAVAESQPAPAAPPASEPVAPLDVKVPSTPPVAVANMPAPQVTQSASPLEATSRIQPLDSVPAPAATPGTAIPAVATGPAGTSGGNTVVTTYAESDAVLLEEVRTLERRGDEIMAEKRVEDAFDLYRTALDSAVEYAARKGAAPAARDQVVTLMKKLAILQVQNTSTAEARATYRQARKVLLQYKTQGQWSRERAKALDEVESRLLSLPQD